MRYFEIAQPSAWYIRGDADLKEAAVGELRSGRLRGQWRLGARPVGIRERGVAIFRGARPT